MMLLGSKQRYQRGRVYKAGKRVKVWRGMWREDTFDTEGKLLRRVRQHQTLGTVAELPTMFDARSRLDGMMRAAASERRIELSFSNLVERWRKAALPALRGSTAAYYDKILEVHLLPEFGSRKVASIGKYDVQLFLAARAAKYSRASLKGMRVALGKVLSWAVECGWLSENPCSKVKIPQGTGKRTRHNLKASDAPRLSAALKEPYSTLVLLLAATGLRISEAIGLRWQDVTPNGLTIRQRVYNGKADELKTAASRRTIHLPSHIMARVLALRASGEYVFQSREGTPPWPNNAMHRYIRPAAKKLGIPLTGYHDFRHGLITRLAEKRVSPKVAAAIAGHSDIRTTLQVYTHVSADVARSAIEEVSGQLVHDSCQLVHDGTRFQKQNQQTAAIQ